MTRLNKNYFTVAQSQSNSVIVSMNSGAPVRPWPYDERGPLTEQSRGWTLWPIARHDVCAQQGLSATGGTAFMLCSLSLTSQTITTKFSGAGRDEYHYRGGRQLGRLGNSTYRCAVAERMDLAKRLPSKTNQIPSTL
jgi:hypothetical protein